MYNSTICTFRFIIVNKKKIAIKKKKVTQNKCIHFCLKYNSQNHMWAKKCYIINWLPTKEKNNALPNALKYWKKTSTLYLKKLFVPSRSKYKTRSYMALMIPLRKNYIDQNSILLMRPSIWKKMSRNLNFLKTLQLHLHHNYKKLNFKKLEWTEYDFNQYYHY